VCSLTRCCNQKRERGVGKEKEQEMEQEREEREKEREKARERAREEKEREQAEERAREEKEKEKVKREEGEEKSERWQRRRRKRPWRVGGDGLWGVPTYPGAWTANLQLPCGSGLMRKIYFRRFLDDFFGEGTVLVSIFRKVAF
jgi:hypothetical protein